MASAAAVEVEQRTADDLLALPDDGRRHELVEGVLRTTTPAGARHGRTAARLLLRVGAHAETHDLGVVLAAETGLVLSREPDTVRAPDLAFVRAEHAAALETPGFAALAPDLVAEVVSPGDRASEVTSKALAWTDAGVLVVWVVDPQSRVVTVHDGAGTRVLRGDDVLDGGDVLPGLAVPLPELWR